VDWVSNLAKGRQATSTAFLLAPSLLGRGMGCRTRIGKSGKSSRREKKERFVVSLLTGCVNGCSKAWSKLLQDPSASVASEKREEKVWTE